MKNRREGQPNQRPEAIRLYVQGHDGKTSDSTGSFREWGEKLVAGSFR
jgi:hypothetical protein